MLDSRFPDANSFNSYADSRHIYLFKLPLEPPKVVTSPPGNIMMKKIGLALTANCSASGVPRPNITWYRDDVRVPSKERLVNGDVFSELYIEKFKPKDQGLYECRISSALERMPTSRYMHVCKSFYIYLIFSHFYNNKDYKLYKK